MKPMNGPATTAMRKPLLLIGTVSALMANTEAALPPWATEHSPYGYG